MNAAPTPGTSSLTRRPIPSTKKRRERAASRDPTTTWPSFRGRAGAVSITAGARAGPRPAEGPRPGLGGGVEPRQARGDAPQVVGVVHPDPQLEEVPPRRRHEPELLAAGGGGEPPGLALLEPEVAVERARR